jgi:hypothetical protein
MLFRFRGAPFLNFRLLPPASRIESSGPIHACNSAPAKNKRQDEKTAKARDIRNLATLIDRHGRSAPGHGSDTNSRPNVPPVAMTAAPATEIRARCDDAACEFA